MAVKCPAPPSWQCLLCPSHHKGSGQRELGGGHWAAGRGRTGMCRPRSGIWGWNWALKKGSEVQEEKSAFQIGGRAWCEQGRGGE